MLINKLKDFGLTDAQAAYLTDELGVENETDLIHLTEADMTAAGLKPIAARKFLAKVGAGGEPKEITVRLDRGERAVTEIDEPDDLLAVLTSSSRPPADRKAAARKLSDMGRRIVAGDDRKTILADETLAFWKRGSLRATHWGRDNRPIVPALSLFETGEKVEVDPYELASGGRIVALDGGYNAESGADWAKVSMKRRALLLLASLAGEPIARGDSVAIAETLSAETLSGKWKVLEQRADADRLAEIEKRLVTSLAEVPTPASAATTDLPRGTYDVGALHAALGQWQPAAQVNPADRGRQFREYLLRAHNASDLQMAFPELRIHLDWNIAYNRLAFDFVTYVERVGMVGKQAFWMRLLEQRPGRADEVRVIARLYGFQL